MWIDVETTVGFKLITGTRQIQNLSSDYVRPHAAHIFLHNDVIKWKHFPRYWTSVRGIHRCPVNSPHKGQWCGALMFSLFCVWINGWVNIREAGDLRLPRPLWRHRNVESVDYSYGLTNFAKLRLNLLNPKTFTDLQRPLLHKPQGMNWLLHNILTTPWPDGCIKIRSETNL